MLTQEEMVAQGYHNKNAITGRYYLGLANQIALSEAWSKSCEWLTFFQAKQNNYRIKPGTKGVQIRFESYVPKDERDSEGNIVSTKNVPYIVYHQVFSIDDCVKVDDNTLPAFDTSTANTYDSKKLISDKQKEFLRKLINQRCRDQVEKNSLLQELPNLSKAQADSCIKNLLNE